jgi:predicted AAA+ superfamily ATPase
MNDLVAKYRGLLRYVQVDFVRSAMDTMPWNVRLLGIRGPRGVGKTTLMLQHIKLFRSNQLAETLYVSLDSIWFQPGKLATLIDEFVAHGGRYLYLDEVHKYPNWAQEVKNAYDAHLELHIVFTGSSALEILNSRADLSRRAVVIDIQGFSFREFLNVELRINLPTFGLDDLIQGHTEVAASLLSEVKPLAHFGRYMKSGYYPFYREDQNWYAHRVSEVVGLILDVELPQLRAVEIAHIPKLRTLLGILAESVPFTPNITSISNKTDITRGTLVTYFHYLEDVGLTRNLFKEGRGVSLLQKPQKVFLDNPNLMHVLAPSSFNMGSLRETFFCNQVGFVHELTYPNVGDFTVDNRYVFEVGGRSKTIKQIQNLEHGFVVADSIELGVGRKIPLWLFGFLY